jgi:hypothetical protein
LLVWWWIAATEKPDFPGFGPHPLRRGNITWQYEIGGSIQGAGDRETRQLEDLNWRRTDRKWRIGKQVCPS